MAKNNDDVTKSRTRSKPNIRKPLREVSNGAVKPPHKSAMKKPTAVSRGGEQLQQQRNDDEALDRLLLVHSDLSSLVHQIDELVVQALKSSSNKQRKEIDAFAEALSEIHVTLKPWVAKFQRALSSPSVDAENEPSSPCKEVPSVNEDTRDFMLSPEENKWESLVSPSPLVSWRPESNNDGGKQLFLLTPLPRPKAFSSKCPESAKSVYHKIASETVVQPLHMEGKADDNLIEGVFVKQTPKEVSNINVIKLGGDCESPAKIPTQSSSALLMTPRLKTSPPKSCVLLEPISEISHKENRGNRKSTPFPVGVKISSVLQESESSSGSSGEASKHLGMNYPELLGLRVGRDFGIRRKVVEESPSWLMSSPPKTCVLMEPPEEKLSSNDAKERPLQRTAPIRDGRDGQTNSSLTEDVVLQMGSLAVKSCKNETIESTPLRKEPESSFKMGKQPGENTLKRELWTKFEAVSTYGVRLNPSLQQKTAPKGFLDRLDEVSREE